MSNIPVAPGSGINMTRSTGGPLVFSVDPETIRDIVGGLLTPGAGISIAVNDEGNSVTISNSAEPLTAENVRDIVGDSLVAGPNMTITVNDATDKITFSATAAEPTGSALANGDYGDIVVSGGGTVLSVDDRVITFTKMLAATGAGLIGATGAGSYGHLALGAGLTISGSAGSFTLKHSTAPSIGIWGAGAAGDYGHVTLGAGLSIIGSAGNYTLNVSTGTTTLANGDYGDIIVSSNGTGMNFDSSVVSNFARTFLSQTSAGGVLTIIGAQPADPTLVALANLTWTGGTQVIALGATDTFLKLTVGAANATDIIDRQTGDARYAAIGSGGGGASSTNSYATRSALAAVTGATNGQMAYLAEAGRQGWFKFNSASQATGVSADAYQGLYVAPAAAAGGGSGAWVREVQSLIYFASWWGINAAFGTTANLPLNSAAALLPSGAFFWLPPETVTISANVVFSNIVHLRGHPYKSTITLSGDPASTGLVLFTVKGCSVEGLVFTTNRTTINQASRSWLITSDGVGDLTVRDCRFLDSSLCIVVYGAGVAAGGGYTRAGYLTVEDCYFETDYQATSFFGVSRGAFRRNVIRPAATPYTGRFVPLVRLLGSTNVVIEDNDIQGFSTTKLDMFGIELSLCQDGKNNRPQNTDITIRRNIITNCYQHVRIDEARGLTLIQDNLFKNNILTDTTGLTQAIFVSTGTDTIDGVTNRSDRVIVEGNTAEGTWSFATISSLGDYIGVKNNRHVASNYNAASSTFDGPVLSLVMGTTGKVEVVYNTFEGAQRFGSRCINFAASGTAFLEVHDNALPEENPSNSTRFNQWGFFGASPSTISWISSKGGTATVGNGSNQFISLLGDNWRNAFGSYGALIAAV